MLQASPRRFVGPAGGRGACRGLGHQHNQPAWVNDERGCFHMRVDDVGL